MTTFRVVPGFSLVRTDEEAQRVGAELERRFGDRPISPAEVVELARRPRSPLHRFFEWDDTKAATAYREMQARELVRSIAVVHTDELGNERRTRAWHSVSMLSEGGEVSRGYVSERIVWASPQLSDQVMTAAYRALLSWQATYALYAELRNASTLVGAAINSLGAER